MDKSKSKIGYSEIGGIFMGKNIQSDFHKNHLISIIISESEPFQICTDNENIISTQCTLIQKDWYYKLKTGIKDNVIFIHIDPYSEIGLSLNFDNNPIISFKYDLFTSLIQEYRDWFNQSENTIRETEILLTNTFNIIRTVCPLPKKIDLRIIRSIEYIKQSNSESFCLRDIAEQVHLSESRLSHLFKEQTGLSFKQLVKQRKLVKSLAAIYEKQNLTTSSLIGGFSDQPHFTKTFKNAFGIKPSASKD